MTVTVYSKPQCVQCDATYRALDKKGIEYAVVNLMLHPDAMEFVRKLGYQQAPVVVTDDQHWSGYRPDLINKITTQAA